MATADIKNIVRLRGRLVKDPTNLSTAFPHGGTALGLARDMVFRFGFKTTFVHAEEFGARVETIFAGETAVFAAVLREFDKDAVSAIFPNTGASGALIKGNASGSGINRAGTLLSSKSFKLLFSPTAVDHHQFVVIYKAVPMLEETAEFQMSLGDEVGIAVMFQAIPDSAGKLYQIGKKADISL